MLAETVKFMTTDNRAMSGLKASATTPLNHNMRLTFERWYHIIRQHPEMAHFQNEIERALTSPDEIYRGRHGEFAVLKRDAIVLKKKRLYVVVYYKPTPGDAFVLTAHPMSSKGVRKKFRKWQKVR